MWLTGPIFCSNECRFTPNGNLGCVKIWKKNQHFKACNMVQVDWFRRWSVMVCAEICYDGCTRVHTFNWLNVNAQIYRDVLCASCPETICRKCSFPHCQDMCWVLGGGRNQGYGLACKVFLPQSHRTCLRHPWEVHCLATKPFSDIRWAQNYPGCWMDCYRSGSDPDTVPEYEQSLHRMHKYPMRVYKLLKFVLLSINFFFMVFFKCRSRVSFQEMCISLIRFVICVHIRCFTGSKSMSHWAVPITTQKIIHLSDTSQFFRTLCINLYLFLKFFWVVYINV